MKDDIKAGLAASALAIPASAGLGYLMVGERGRKEINKEIRDPRLYSNMRHSLKSQEERVRAHKTLDRRKDHTVLSAMREGFGNKIAHIEPDIFASFAKNVMGGYEKDHQSEVDELDPSSPYRDSTLNAARPNEQSRMNASGAPRRDYARPEVKTSGVMRALVGRFSQQHARRFEEDLEGRFGSHEDVIPGSMRLVPGGIEYSTPSDARMRYLKKKYQAKE